MLTAASFAAERTIVILDASGSMWGQIDGRPKQEIARETLRTVLANVPSATEIGFMSYGHRETDSCGDIELIVPPRSGSATAIVTALDGLSFRGKTPLTVAVKQAAEALNYTVDKATVILVTDGAESCSADPCALAGELETSGADFTAHVVGFGLTAEQGKQVSCLADKTGGKFIQAGDASALAEALNITIAAAPPTNAAPPAVAQPTETPAPTAMPTPVSPLPTDTPTPTETPTPEPTPVPEPPAATPVVELTPAPEPPLPTATPVPALPADAQGESPRAARILVDASYAEGGETVASGALDIRIYASERLVGEPRLLVAQTARSGSAMELPPGSYVASVRLDRASIEVPFEIAGGETKSLPVVLDAGVLAITAPGADSIELFARSPGGVRTSFGLAFGESWTQTVPAGDYDVERTLPKTGDRKQAPATVRAGERTEILVD